MKIVSLVPSITELLYDLGLEEEVAGITKFCVHPQHGFRNKTRIGGTKNINIEKIKSLQPDLIIANKEENVKEQIEQLRKYNILLTDVNNFDEALEMIKTVGNHVHKEFQAAQIIAAIKKRFSALHIEWEKTAAYLIWKDPYMTVGGDTFIDSMMCKAGFKNIFSHQNRYLPVTIEAIKELRPEYILLSTEPYPFKEKHVAALQALVPNSKVILADGEMFSWYGSRMLYAVKYFAGLK